jgi:hypothetical protein
MSIFSRKSKEPFEELKDVFKMIGKGLALRNTLLNGFQITEDLDEAYAFIASLPEAIIGAKLIKFEYLTDEQQAELRQLVKDEWKVPDSVKIEGALPKLVGGLLLLGQGFDEIF